MGLRDRVLASRTEERVIGSVSEDSGCEQRLGYCMPAQVQFLADFSHSQAGSTKFFNFRDHLRCQFRTALIHVLLDRISPFTVFRFVVAFVVNTVERSALRFRSHIFEEVTEVKPAFADSYTSAAPVLPSRMIRVEATPLHVAPGVVLRTCEGASLSSVLEGTLTDVRVHTFNYRRRTLGAQAARKEVGVSYGFA